MKDTFGEEEAAVAAAAATICCNRGGTSTPEAFRQAQLHSWAGVVVVNVQTSVFCFSS